ncbi:peptidase domain-containing ABC transporter [Acinetobacter sp.]|uniref:peptidase domain-containing ABC transporter n=1 Tax=Acinetobacter sp. TaxID=472 RepID=UPI00388FD90F
MSYIGNLNFSFFPKVPIIFQTEASECGLACVAMISSYYGHNQNIHSLRQKHAISIKGLTLKDLINICEKNNFNSRPLRLELHELANLRLPAIVHVNMDHFVVLTAVSKSTITVIDPASGTIKHNINDFSEIFTGIALELWPNSKFEEKSEVIGFKLKTLFKDLIFLSKPFSYLLVLAIVLELLSLTTPLYMQFILDNVIPFNDVNLLNLLTLAFVTLFIFNIIISTTQTLLGLFISTTLNVQWKSNILNHLVNLPNKYFVSRHLGDILSRFNAIDPIQSTLTSTLIITVLNGILAIFTLFLMFYFSPVLALISLISMLTYLVVRIVSYAPLRNYMEKGIVLSANQNTYLMETIRGIRSLKQHNKQNSRAKNWLSLFINQTNNSLSTQKLTLTISILNKFIFGIENFLIVWIGSSLVMENSFTIGFFMAYIAYKTQFAGRFSSLIDSYIQIKMLSLYGERLSDIVLTDPEKNNTLPISSEKKLSVKGDIKVENISFKYGEYENDIIENISFHILPGQSVAFTGPSGEGKTTLINILNGTLEPTKGVVYIDNIPLNKFGIDNLRSIVSCVDQNDHLFAGTILENISFFHEDPDIDYIEECAKLACIHEEINNMPMGYLTLVGDMGSSLSGGQKQRILIARALYQKPRILFMDEATSHLDTQNEKVINKNISNLNITRIFIAHRKETILSSDRIISIKNKKILFDKYTKDV